MKASNTSLGSEESPDYGVMDSDTFTSISVAGALFMLTIGSMLVFADTPVGDAVIGLYQYLPIVGMIVVGGVLTLGYYLTMKGLKNDSIILATIGAGTTIFGYGAFGAAVLTPYAPDLYEPAIVVSGIVTGVIGLIASMYVYSTDRSFKSWGAMSGKIFLGAIITVAIGSFLPGVLGGLVIAVGFVLVLLGFICDLVYEIWQVSSGRRTPLENGFGLYVAFTGVFVHILQIVLQVMSGDS